MKHLLIFSLFLLKVVIAFSQEKIDSSDVYIATNFDNCSYGLKNRKGEWILPPNYNYIHKLYEYNEFFITEKNDNKGLVDVNGKIILNTEYSYIEAIEYKYQKISSNRFSNANVFKVRKNGKEGLFNVSKNTFILGIEFNDIIKDESYVIFENESRKFGLADSNGIVLKPKYDGLDVFDKSFIKVSEYRNNISLFGVINKKGKTIIKGEYSNIYFVNKCNSILFFAEQTQDNIRIIDIYNEKGKKLHQFFNTTIDYNIESSFSLNGTCMFSTVDSAYVINIKGTIIYRGNIANIRHINLRNHLSKVAFIVNQNNICTGFDNQGKVIINTKYESLELIRYGCEPYSENQSKVRYGFIAKKGDKYGVISDNDSLIFPFIHDNIYNSIHKLYLVVGDKITPISLIDFNNTIFESTNTATVSVYSESNWNDKGDFEYPNIKSGLVDKNGYILLQPLYNIKEAIGDKKLYFSSSNHKNGYIDIDGNIHFNDKQQFVNITPLTNNRYIVESTEFLLGVSDSNFNVILEPKFEAISDVIDGNKIWVEVIEGKCDTCKKYEVDDDYVEPTYQLFNTDGILLNESHFNNYCNFFNHRAIAANRGKFSILDANGKLLMPFKYDQILRQDSNYFFLNKNDSWTLTDWNLKPISYSNFKSITPILNNGFFYKDSLSQIGFCRLDGYQIDNCIAYFNKTGVSLFDRIELNDVKEKYYWNSNEYDDYFIDNFHSLDTINNGKFKHFIKNELASIVLNNLFFENGNYNNEEEILEMNYPLDNESAWEDYLIDPKEYESNSITIHYVDQSLVCYQSEFSSCFLPPRGMGHCDMYYDFYNYRYVNDSIYLLKLSDLFINEYHTTLKKAFIKAYEELERNSSDCKNINEILNSESTNFIIDEEGLILYTQNDIMDIDMIDDFEVMIPYTELNSIISSNSVLKRFIK